MRRGEALCFPSHALLPSGRDLRQADERPLAWDTLIPLARPTIIPLARPIAVPLASPITIPLASHLGGGHHAFVFR